MEWRPLSGFSQFITNKQSKVGEVSAGEATNLFDQKQKKCGKADGRHRQIFVRFTCSEKINDPSNSNYNIVSHLKNKLFCNGYRCHKK